MKNMDRKNEELKKLLEIKRIYSESEENSFIQSTIYVAPFEDAEIINLTDVIVYDKFKSGLRTKKK